MATELTDDTFDDFIRRHRVVMVDFYATWCSPCMQIMKILPRLEMDLVGMNDVVIAKVDIDKNPRLKEKWSIQKVPSFLFFKDGEEEVAISGVTQLALMKKTLEDLS